MVPNAANFAISSAPLPASQVLRDQPRRSHLPVIEGPLGHFRPEPRKRLFGCRVRGAVQVRLAAAVWPESHDVREVKSVVVPPLVRRTEISPIAWFESVHAFGEQQLEFDGALQYVV